MKLTPTDIKVLVFLSTRTKPATGRMIAHALWPDSPAWSKRTVGRGASRHNGSLAGTMPMLGAKAAHRAAEKGLVQWDEDPVTYQSQFTITPKGRAALETSH